MRSRRASTTPPRTSSGPTSRSRQQLIVSAAANVYKDSAPDFYPNMNTYALPWESKKAISRIHPITINNQSEKGEAAMEFLTWLYAPENYRNLLTRSLDVIPAYEVGGLDDYFASIHWLTGFQDINMITPPEMVGDFIFNNDEFGQIVITNFRTSWPATSRSRTRWRPRSRRPKSWPAGSRPNSTHTPSGWLAAGRGSHSSFRAVIVILNEVKNLSRGHEVTQRSNVEPNVRPDAKRTCCQRSTRARRRGDPSITQDDNAAWQDAPAEHASNAGRFGTRAMSVVAGSQPIVTDRAATAPPAAAVDAAHICWLFRS